MRFLGLGHRNAGEYKTAEIYRDLRQRVLTFDPAAIGFKPTETGRIWGFLMEIGLPKAVATLVVLADGTVSLYFSNGGGLIGLGQHEVVRKAGLALLAEAPGFLAYTRSTKEFPLPQKGYTRFYFLTLDGAFTAEAPEEELGNGRVPLSPLFFKAHEVITQARLVHEKLHGASTENA